MNFLNNFIKIAIIKEIMNKKTQIIRIIFQVGLIVVCQPGTIDKKKSELK